MGGSERGTHATPAWAASANQLNALGLPVVPLSCSDDLSMEPTDCLQEVSVRSRDSSAGGAGERGIGERSRSS
jgi:hypothetical protein